MTQASETRPARSDRRATRPAAPAPRRAAPATGSRAERRQAARARRNRLMFACAVVVSVLIVVAWFPVSELVHERQQLAGATSQLGKIRHNVRSLNAEAKRLQTPTQVARIAQTQDGLAPAGDQLYQVLPSSGQTTTPTTTPPAGSPATTTTTFPAAPQHTATPGATSSPGFFGRVVQTLEFWQ